MKEHPSWWTQAGELLRERPGLLAPAKEVRGFGGGARWMHGAMLSVGWRLPPFLNPERHARRGWIKYGICSFLALAPGLPLLVAGWWWLAWLPTVLLFYLAEARMVFLFPEALRGRRHPWLAAWALTTAAGGAFRVMGQVLPIAVRMLASGWWRGRGREMWVRGCLAVVLWHRAIACGQIAWTEDGRTLQKWECGPVGPLLLRRESVGRAGGKAIKVLWISDLHWRGPADGGTLLALLKILRKERPGLCILGGDFLESRSALPLLARLARGIQRASTGIALPGNHDRGRFAGPVREVFRAAGIAWLPERGSISWQGPDGARLRISGAEAAAAGAWPGEERQLVAVHDPAELDGVSLPASGNAVVMAGHLHGGQFVASARDGRLLPAAWIYRHARLRQELAGVSWLVSRGAGDTLPLRWNCPREVMLCEITL